MIILADALKPTGNIDIFFIILKCLGNITQIQRITRYYYENNMSTNFTLRTNDKFSRTIQPCKTKS